MIKKHSSDIEVLFKRMIMASLLFHATIVLFFTAQKIIFPSERIEYQSAIRVDLIGLPDKKPEVMPVEEVKEAPKVELKQEESKPKEQKKEAQKKNTKPSIAEALRKLKKEKALEDLKKSQQNEERIAAEKAQPTQFKGNIISPGTSLRGLDRMQYDEYLGRVQSHIQNNWSLPEWLQRLELKAIALVKIDKNGYVIDKRLVQSSGNTEFDRLVISTVEASSPFPAPPEKMQALVGIDGVTLGFPE